MTSFRVESACRRQDGEPLRAIVHVSAVLGPDGSPQYLVAQLEDVTERHRLEVELHKERGFLDAVLDNLDTGIVACDANGSLTLFNRASRKIHGLPSDASLVPEQWAVRYDLFHGDGTTPLRLTDIPLFRALSGERVRNAEMVIAPENGAPVTIVSNAERLLNHDGTVLGAVATMHDVTARRRAEAALVHQARHDTLTGLANRRQLRERLGDALDLPPRDGESSVRLLLLLDLDGFKTVNDALGHHSGDRLLAMVSHRVVGCLRSTDTAARLGGDEFAILLPYTTADEARHVAERILGRLSEPFDIDGVTVTVGVSIGIADAAGVTDVDALLRNADLAMYQAKAAGKGQVMHYEPRMHEALLAGSPWKGTSARRFRRSSSHCSTSLSMTCRTAKLSPWRPCCGGTIPVLALYHQQSSFASRRPQASSNPSATGFSTKPVGRRASGSSVPLDAPSCALP